MTISISQLSLLKNKSGIYKITCSGNKKIYIGSSKNLYNRIKYCHLASLSRNKHYNSYLQSAWNKYGKESFIFEILEFIEDIDILRKKEYFYIFKFKSLNRRFGYNMWKSYYVTDRESINYKNLEYNLLTPENKIIKGKNIYSLCKEYNIPLDTMIKLIKCEKKYYKNWINLNNLPEVAKFISPNNIIYEIFLHDLEKFAKFHKIKGQGIFKRLLKGEWESIKGWRVADKILKEIILIDPIGNKFKIIKGQYRKFCRKMNIPLHTINRVLVNTSKCYKNGWRLSDCA